VERKGASYRITSKRAAQDPSAHAQVRSNSRIYGSLRSSPYSSAGDYDSEPDPDRMREDQYDREWEERYG
jgi:hypothetical protein